MSKPPNKERLMQHAGGSTQCSYIVYIATVYPYILYVKLYHDVEIPSTTNDMLIRMTNCQRIISSEVTVLTYCYHQLSSLLTNLAISPISLPHTRLRFQWQILSIDKLIIIQVITKISRRNSAFWSRYSLFRHIVLFVEGMFKLYQSGYTL